MGYQSKIAKATAPLKRKLRDYAISVAGDDVHVIRLQMVENKYEDITSYSILSHDDLVVVLDIPSDIPLQRLRTDVSQIVTTTENTFLYDIIPIRGWARTEDHVEKNDILIHKVWDEDDIENGTNLLWVLRVSEILGNISHGHLTGRHFLCSPHNDALPSDVQALVDTYNT